MPTQSDQKALPLATFLSLTHAKECTSFLVATCFFTIQRHPPRPSQRSGRLAAPRASALPAVELTRGAIEPAIDLSSRTITVRARAANPAGWVYKGGATFAAATYTYSPQTTPADNYKISQYPVGNFLAGGQAYARKAVQFERRLELAMEGHRFFDLQRWDNGTGSMADVINT